MSAAPGSTSGSASGPPVPDATELYRRGDDLAEAGRHEEAAAAFARAAELGDPDALLALGNSLRELDRPEEAADAFARAADSGDEAAWLNLGLVQEQLAGGGVHRPPVAVARRRRGRGG